LGLASRQAILRARLGQWRQPALLRLLGHQTGAVDYVIAEPGAIVARRVKNRWAGYSRRPWQRVSMMDRLVIGISGASGVQYGVRALELLKPLPIETHLVMSKSAELTVHHELDCSVADIRALADEWHPVRNVGASIASGSFRTLGMLLVPCSIRTLGEITSGVTSSLLTRAADVVLKERRRLVLMVRETPLHLGHLRNMVAVTEMGAIVAPPVPAFYTKPASLDAAVTQSVARALDLFDLALPETHRWTES
jgi:4-hydroxy-3-polyprenylbenzoate decarboxylase